MKHFYKSLMVIAMFFSFLGIKAQGWPAEYEGVMLQGFYWDSYADTKWTNLESQADVLSKYFDLIWIPNSASSDNGMGYMPVYWFSNYNSRFGTEAELRKMIKTFKAKGTGFIADVVINHRNGNQSAWDFPAETYKGKTYDMADGSIVANDNIWSNMDGWGKGCPSSYKGAYDTGDLFDGCRDLDHTNATVQEHIKAYTEFLLSELEYAGFRYDMVKGYDGKYTKIYNEYSKPKFSVGEFWDSSYDNVAKWIDATGKTSAAFDFPCKYQINAAFNNGYKLSELVWNANGTNPQPAGMIHYGYPQYSVTFVDNHDTARDGSAFTGNVLAANAFILCSPGTPCVFLKHYLDYPLEIKYMINARKKAGVTNTSTVKELSHTSNCYMAEVTGKRGKLAVKIGPDMVSPSGYSDSDIYTSGTDYCIWVKDNGSYVAPDPSKDPDNNTVENGITIYYNNTNTNYSQVYCYSFGSDGNNGKAWPGYKMTAVGGNVYSVAVPQGSSVVFNNGDNGQQTVDVLNVVNGYIYTGTTKTDSKNHNTVEAGVLFDGILPAPSGTLYFNGNFDDFTGDWDPTQAKEMSKEPGHYTLRNIKMNGSGGEAHFSFADTKGDWDTVNKGIRYGASKDGEEVTVIKDSKATSPSYTMTAGNHDAWKVKNGNYDIVVEPGTWKLTVYEAGKAPNFNVSILPDNGNNDNNQGNENQGEENNGEENQGDNNQGDQSGEDNNPSDDQPGGDQPGNDQPSEDQPGSDQPGNEPSGDEPGSDQPGSDQPGNEPSGDQPGDNQGEGDNSGDDQNNGADDENQGSGPSEDNNGGENSGDLPGNEVDDPDPDAGVNGIQAEDATPEYYTLQGIKVQNPGKGMYIKVTGDKREKIVIR